jgi:DNA-binding NtrC family response regulator
MGNPGMKKLRVAVVNADVPYCREICALVEQANASASAVYSLEDLPERLQKEPVRIVILDLDTVQVDNTFFRRLKKLNPDVQILCLSSRSHHPGLEEAMGSYIYASLAKPLNVEELFFWLKSIEEI